MKIYIIPTQAKFQPDSQKVEYPSGNTDYGVEQDFLEYLKKSRMTTSNATDADWHYLPIYWTRWHLNHDYARDGINELKNEVADALTHPRKAFTICQYDDGPVVNLGATKLFLASRKGEKGYDIPLLRNKLKTPLIKPRKSILASFVGRLDTHAIRKEMSLVLKNDPAFTIINGDKGQKFFINQTISSYVCLCPRGYGGSSFRFFEAMQLGIVPFLIGDIDTRPFKKYINWDEISFYADSPAKIPLILRSVSQKQLKAMGMEAKTVYTNHLQYGKWPSYVIKQLRTIK